MHVVIEGIDGVGKSTAAKAVADVLGFALVEKPLQYIFDKEGQTENYIRIRDYFNEQPDRFLSAWFYGLGSLYVHERFEGQNIVMVRHLLSNYCWSGAQCNLEVYDLLVSRLGAPEFTFILYADPDVVSERIRGRDAMARDVHKISFIPEAYRKMEEFCNRYNMPYELIDTGKLSATEVKDKIIEIIKRKQR